MIYALASIIFVAAIIFWLWGRKKSTNDETNVQYIPKGDPNAQVEYEKTKFPPSASITMQELLELSWKFLYDLTEIVLNRFSVRDQQTVMQQGRVMISNGMKYIHVVDSNPKVIELYTKKVTEVGKSSAEIGRQ